MFVKLLKHEWRANRGLVGLLCAIIAISGVLLGGSLRYSVWSTLTENSLMVTVYAMIVLVAELAILGCVFLAMYFLAYRFYKSRFEDQGYLMLTLPVTTHEHLLSSIVNTIIGVILVGLTAIVSTVVAMSALINIYRDPLAVVCGSCLEGDAGSGAFRRYGAYPGPECDPFLPGGPDPVYAGIDSRLPGPEASGPQGCGGLYHHGYRGIRRARSDPGGDQQS